MSAAFHDAQGNRNRGEVGHWVSLGLEYVMSLFLLHLEESWSSVVVAVLLVFKVHIIDLCSLCFMFFSALGGVQGDNRGLHPGSSSRWTQRKSGDDSGSSTLYCCKK